MIKLPWLLNKMQSLNSKKWYWYIIDYSGDEPRFIYRTRSIHKLRFKSKEKAVAYARYEVKFNRWQVIEF